MATPFFVPVSRGLKGGDGRIFADAVALIDEPQPDILGA